MKNLSKAERLIYGDSLMTHAMILTAVTDKVHTQKHRESTDVSLFSKLVQTRTNSHTHMYEFPRVYCIKVLLHVYVALGGCSFFIVLSISPLVNSPSCQDTFISLISSSLSFLPISCLLISKDGKEGYEKWRVENSWGDDRGNKGNL